MLHSFIPRLPGEREAQWNQRVPATRVPFVFLGLGTKEYRAQRVEIKVLYLDRVMEWVVGVLICE